MDSHEKTAYCGIYCPDCIHYKNKYSTYASQLKTELEQIDFPKYAEIDSPFGTEFKEFDAFQHVLKALSGTQCDNMCRVGGGCSGTPCKIMKCCLTNGYAGCWECHELDACENFDFLEPRCGDMPKNNIKKIQKYGIQTWVGRRDPFYIWQKQ